MPDALDKAFIATEVSEVYELSDEERSLIEDGVAELDRGEYVKAADHRARIADVLKR